MKPERLQEIKLEIESWLYDEDADWSIFNELITALEAAQAELELKAVHNIQSRIDALDEDDWFVEINERFANMEDSMAYIHITSLRAQLAEALEAVEYWKYEMPELRESEM